MAAHGEPCAFFLALDDKALHTLELALYRQRTQVSLCVIGIAWPQRLHKALG